MAVNQIEMVNGLYYARDFLTPAEQRDCLIRVDAAQDEWLNDLSRRVQHYGWRYDYKARVITRDMHIGAMPDWLDEIAQKLHQVELPDGQKLFERPPEQVIVNEYVENQGIAMHIDHRGFGPNRLHNFAARILGDGLPIEEKCEAARYAGYRLVRVLDGRLALPVAARHRAPQTREGRRRARSARIPDLPNRR